MRPVSSQVRNHFSLLGVLSRSNHVGGRFPCSQTHQQRKHKLQHHYHCSCLTESAGTSSSAPSVKPGNSCFCIPLLFLAWADAKTKFIFLSTCCNQRVVNLLKGQKSQSFTSSTTFSYPTLTQSANSSTWNGKNSDLACEGNIPLHEISTLPPLSNALPTGKITGT